MDLAKTLVDLVGDHTFAMLRENPCQGKRSGTYLDEHHVLT